MGAVLKTPQIQTDLVPGSYTERRCNPNNGSYRHSIYTILMYWTTEQELDEVLQQ